MHRVLITTDNPALKELSRRWVRPAFSADDGIAPLDSLHQASDTIVAVAGYFGEVLVIVGSGVMIGPGLVLTATHVLDEFPKESSGPVLLTFLPDGARAWLPTASVCASGKSEHGVFDERMLTSDLSVVSCSLNSDALVGSPYSLSPLKLCLPLPGQRLWAIGFRDAQVTDDTAATPFVSSGLVANCYPHGRGERMPSPCIEISMDAYGGMSGGPVLNEEGQVVGIVSSSFEGGPTYATLIWDAMRFSIKGLPKNIWGCGQSGLAEGVEAGLVRINGDYQCNLNQIVKLTVTDQEMEMLQSTQPGPPNA